MALSPMDFTFGVEIECLLPTGKTRADLADAMIAAGISASVEAYNHQTRGVWKIVTDATIGYENAECVSPILKGEAGLATAHAACAAIEAFGCTVDKRCGLHVHVGVPEGRRPSWNDPEETHSAPVEFMKRLMGLYAKHEKTIDELVPPSRRVSQWCRALAPKAGAVKRAKTFAQLQRIYRRDRERYFKLNLQAYWRHGTVEFRQHSGTVEGRKVVNWIRFCLAMCTKAAEQETPASRHTARLPLSATITEVGSNPHRYGSAASQIFQVYRVGMTIQQALSEISDVMQQHNAPASCRASWYVANHLRNNQIDINLASASQQAQSGLAALLAEIDVPEDLAIYLTARHARFAEAA